MKRIIQIPNRSISQMVDEYGVIGAMKKLGCNENLSFISDLYRIGEGTIIHKFCNLFGNSNIGKNCIISSFVEIQGGVIVGDNCRIGSFSFLCSGVELEENVFLGSHICTINDRHPKPHNKEYKQEKTLIKNGASIGSGSVLICGITIGENSMVGAGSLVLKDIPAHQLWYGSPAKFIKNI